MLYLNVYRGVFFPVCAILYKCFFNQIICSARVSGVDVRTEFSNVKHQIVNSVA